LLVLITNNTESTIMLPAKWTTSSEGSQTILCEQCPDFRGKDLQAMATYQETEVPDVMIER